MSLYSSNQTKEEYRWLNRQTIVGVVLGWLCALSVGNVHAAEPPVFENDVLPIFTKYCLNCHGKSSPQLGLDLRSARLLMRGSQNGKVIVKGSLEKSLLWEKVSKREMPLAQFKLKLSDKEIDTVRRWILGGALSSQATRLPADVQAQFDHFDREILPLFAKHCVECHGADDPESKLDLRSLKSLLQGSKTGPVIVEGFSDKSILIRKLASKMMPPPDAGTPLTPKEIRTITRWIDKGRFADFVDVTVQDTTSADQAVQITAQDREFWAFKKPTQARLPQPKNAQRVRTPIDNFLLETLEAQGLTFSPDAAPQTLLRRVYFDLTGLPPTVEQAQEFLADKRPDAYQRLIDELLRSPRYGERWGRHWLDVIGYVDTTGKDFNPNGLSLSDGYWRYRDYVIQATNKDVPWNQFLTEQIAGDELVDWRNAKEFTPEILEKLTATGFLRNVLDATNEDISNLPFDRYEALFKLMERVSTSTMGLTLACARCHTHKFDPIPHTDYYRFLALFTPAYNPTKWLQPKQRHLYHVSAKQQEEFKKLKATTSQKLVQLNKQLNLLRAPYKERLFDAKLAELPAQIRADTKAAIKADVKKRTPVQAYLVEKFAKQLTVDDKAVDKILQPADRQKLQDFQAAIRAKQQTLASLQLQKVQALWDVGQPPTIRLLHRGDVDFAGPKVTPGFLSVLSQPGQTDATSSLHAKGETNGLRLAFAEWLTSPDHPLTARVIVNRIWQHHFGKGIVSTPGNFGETGSRPTHPELLDWMAVEFMKHGWSAKRLHRTIMLSTAYRQSAARGPESAKAIDPNNDLLGRVNLRRLDAEALRDSVLAVSGQADYKMGGPPVLLKSTKSGLQTVITDTSATASRRSIYLAARRSNPMTFLRVFDYPVIDVSCTRRSTSATPLQSLTMINSKFLANSAGHLADHIVQRTKPDVSVKKKVETAYWLTFSRAPSETEIAGALSYLKNLEQLYVKANPASKDAAQHTFKNFVHMLLCSNEFLYVD